MIKKFIFISFSLFCYSQHSLFAEKIDKNSDDCVAITKHFEKKYNMPKGILLAIATVESKRNPWAVNNFKSSKYFETLEQATDYIVDLESNNKKNISLGYMQINWVVHKNSLGSMEKALMPYYNIKFAAKLLCRLNEKFGSWEDAIRWYNPKKKKPNDTYLKKVKTVWCYSA